MRKNPHNLHATSQYKNYGNFPMAGTNAAIGSGFDENTGTFSGDSRSSSLPRSAIHEPITDHPFHNVDQNTMMAMKKALVVLQKVKGDNSVHQIADRLYLGSIGAALNLPELLSVGITHILCTATGVRSMHPDKFVYRTLTVLDSHSESLIDHFPDSIHWIECVLRENISRKILVHCFAGRSRSVAIVLAYLMYKLRIPLSVALLHVRQFRTNANPNMGFINQLKAFEQELFTSKRSFAFDTLLDDLNSLIPGAKERLLHINEARASLNSEERNRRPSSADASPGASSPVSGRRGSWSSSLTSSQQRRLSVKGPSSPSSEVSDSFKKDKRSPIRSEFARWLIMILLMVCVIWLERISFPYYSRALCDGIGPQSTIVQEMCEKKAISKPSRFEKQVAGAISKVFETITGHFPSF
jgi:protein-tyrosine phosphatase